MTEPRRHAITFDFKPESWMEDGACVGHDPRWWFADDRGRLGSTAMSSESLAALNICASCPVRLKCLDYAMRTETASSHTWGIWGGSTAEQRRKLARDAS